MFRVLPVEFPGIRMVGSRPTRDEGCFHSIALECDEDLSFLAGTTLWICESPLHPHRRRKRWCIWCSVIPEAEGPNAKLGRRDVRLGRFRSGSHGSQNVNKVEVGVRLVHVPAGVTATSTEERAQHASHRVAERRLAAALADREERGRARRRNDA